MAEQKQEVESLPIAQLPGSVNKVITVDPTKALEAVKDAVLKKLKDSFGYEPEYYKPTTNGSMLALMGGQWTTGVVQFSGEEGGPGEYGSILISQVVGTQSEQPYELQGFIVGGQTLPYILHVKPGQYQVDGGIINDKCKEELAKKNPHVKLSLAPGTPYAFGVYLPYYDLSFVQQCVNLQKDEILKKVGLNGGSITQFNVTAALNANSFSLRLGYFKARISIGTRNGYLQEISVQFTNFVLGDQQTVTVNDAFLWG